MAFIGGLIMKAVLALVSLAFIAQVEAKCLASGTHNILKGGSATYDCPRKASEVSDVNKFAPAATSGPGANLILCINCGCDVKVHDDMDVAVAKAVEKPAEPKK